MVNSMCGIQKRVGGAGLVCALLSIAAAVDAQSNSPSIDASGQPANQSQSATMVLEPGDVYLNGSRVYALVGKTGFGHEHGVMGGLLSGHLALDSQQNAGQLTFDLRSFYADSDAARQYVGLAGSTAVGTQQEVNANMLGGAVLDTVRFPTATFDAVSAVRLPQPSSHGLPQYDVAGNLTFHGVTRPIHVIAEAEERPGWVHLRGGFSLVQSQFGIQPFTKAFGAVGVADEVKVYGDLWIARDRQVIAAAGAR
jgi:polyisoprenoid-binding protein YceI